MSSTRKQNNKCYGANTTCGFQKDGTPTKQSLADAVMVPLSNLNRLRYLSVCEAHFLLMTVVVVLAATTISFPQRMCILPLNPSQRRGDTKIASYTPTPVQATAYRLSLTTSVSQHVQDNNHWNGVGTVVHKGTVVTLS